MAAPLTWRNVDTPDFRGSLQGLQIASGAFDRAFTGLDAGLDKFQTNRTEMNDRAMLAGALRYQDPEAYKAALASGSIMGGIDPAMVSSKALGAVDARTGDLLNRAVTEQALGTSRQLDPIRIRQAGLTADGSELDNRFKTDTYGNRVTATALANEQARAGIDSTRAGTESTRTGTEFARRSMDSRLLGLDLGNQTTRQNLDQNAEKFGWQRDDRGETRVSAEWEARILGGTISAQDTQELLSSPEFAKLPPTVQSRVLNRAEQLRPGTTNPNAVASAGTPAGTINALGQPVRTPSTSSLVSTSPTLPQETRSYVDGIVSKVGTLSGSVEERVAAVMPHLINRESGGRHTNPDGSLVTSPMGASGVTQVMRATGEDPGFGVKPLQNQSREEYERFGRDYLTALVKNYDGNMELALAAYNHGPGNVDKWLRDNPEARRTDVTSAASQTRDLGRELAGRQGQNRSGMNSLVPNYDQLMQTNTTPGAEATRLRTSGPYASMTQEEVINQLNTMVANSNGRLNIATAGKILEDSPEGSGVIGRAMGRLFNTSTVTPNQSRVDAVLSSVNRGETNTAAGQDSRMTATSAQIVNAQAALEKANTDLDNALRSPMMSEAARNRYRAQRERAMQAWRRATGGVLNEEGEVRDDYRVRTEQSDRRAGR